MADLLAVQDEYRAQTWAMLHQKCWASGMSNICYDRGSVRFISPGARRDQIILVILGGLVYNPFRGILPFLK